MRILHIVTGMQKASGVTVFVEELTRELRALGHEVTVVTRNEGLDVSKFSFDVIHINGLWDPWLHKWFCIAHKAGIPVVWSPHGMLQKWALKNKWWKKLAALALYQWRDLHSAALLHATAQSEVEDIRRIGLHNKVVVAPLGVRLPLERIRTFEHSNIRTLLFVSRVQRKKGLPNLIEAWSRLPQDLRNGWQVRIVGPEQDGHVAELKAQCDSLGVSWYDCLLQSNNRTIEQSSIVFAGPKYDSELATEYSTADLFILPTHSENFGSVVIEALAHGVPVICTKAAPWGELVEFHCGWWIEDSVSAIFDALREAIMSARVLPEMGDRGRMLVANKYAWRSVGRKMLTAYELIISAQKCYNK